MNTRTIYTSKGDAITVDAADYEELNAFLWHLNGNGYAVRTRRIGGGRKATIFMHRHLLGLHKGDGQFADHINLNRADNRRENLRVATWSQNQCNRATRSTSGSGIKGVFKEPGQNKWKPYIDAHGKRTYLGTFTDPEAAAACRRMAAEALHGAFARHV
jgi:hypothetical protein